MREMKDSGIEWIGTIPDNWDIMPNKYLMWKKKKICPVYNGEDIISLSMNGVIVRDLDAGGKMPTSFDGYQYIESGNLLMCLFDIDVTPRCIGLIKCNGLTSPAYSQFVLINRANAGYYNYYYTMLDNDKTLVHLAKNLRHSLTEEQLGTISTIVPPIDEQIKISDYLDKKCEEINSVVAQLQEEIEALEEYKKSLVFQIVSNGTRKSKLQNTISDVWLTIPENWKLVDIKYLFEIIKRIAGQEGFDILSVTQKGLKVKDISTNEGQIAESYAGYQFVYPTDYVMNHMDLLTGWVDCSTMFGVTSPDYRVFRLRDKENNDLIYFKYVMQCCYMSRIFYSLGQGVSNLGRWRLQTSAFNNFMIPVPPLEEQREIAEYLDTKISEIDTIIADKEQQIETIEEYKKSLIFEYVTGKKEVQA